MSSTSPWWFSAAAVVGYLVGSISPAAIVARVRRVDLRGSGSGNPGAANAARVMGVRTGVVVGVLDILKGFLPAIAFGAVDHAAGAVAGLAAVVGHVSSPFLRGRGGKGVATSLGAVLGVDPLWAVPVLAVFGLVAAFTHRMGVAAVCGALMLVPAALVWSDGGWWGVAFAAALTLIIVVRHRSNLATAWRESRGRG